MPKTEWNAQAYDLLQEVTETSGLRGFFLVSRGVLTNLTIATGLLIILDLLGPD